MVSHRYTSKYRGKISNRAYYKNKDGNFGNCKDILKVKERFKLYFTSRRITKNDVFLYLLSYLCCQRKDNDPGAQQKDGNKMRQSLKTLGSTYIDRQFSGSHVKTNLTAQCQYQKQNSSLETQKDPVSMP